MLRRLGRLLVLENNKRLAAHADVFMGYDIEDFAELGESGL